MQTPTSGVAPDEEDVLPLLLDEDEELLQPLEEVVEPLLLDEELLQPLEEVVEPLLLDDELLQPLEELLLVEPLEDVVDPQPSPPHGTPRIPTSPPATRATQTRPGLHLFSALHS